MNKYFFHCRITLKLNINKEQNVRSSEDMMVGWQGGNINLTDEIVPEKPMRMRNLC